MIELLIKNVFDNSNKIDAMAKHINKTNKKTCLQILLMTAAVYVVTMTVKDHEDRIKELEEENHRIKSILT